MLPKSYIEGDQLRDFTAVEQSLDQLRVIGLHPHVSKILEDTFVMYWRAPVSMQQEQLIRESFSKNNVHMRGFAQDPHYIVLTDQGVSVKRRATNDTAFGWENPFSELKEIHYKADTFLKQYSELTYWAYKNPARPYSASFLPIFVNDDVDFAQIEEQVRRVQHIAENVHQIPAIIFHRK